MVSAVDDSLDFIPPLRSVRVRKVKPVITSKYNLKQLYYDARRVMFKREYPSSEYFDKPVPDVTTTNGTTRYIEDVINNYGHMAERINTQGNYYQGKWRKSGSTKGSPDIHCVVNKTPWKIEVKKGADDLSKAQLKYQSKMLALGLEHTVIYVGQLDKFWEEYWRMIKL